MDKIEIGFLVSFVGVLVFLGAYVLQDGGYHGEKPDYMNIEHEFGAEGTLEIHVSDSDSGESLENVSVYENNRFIGNTDSEGRLDFDANDKELQIQAENDGYEVKKTNISLESGVEDDDQDANEEPQFSLNSPNDRENLETFDEESNVDFKYRIKDRGWAEEAKIEIKNTDYEFTRPISSDQTYGDNFNPDLEPSNKYTWIVTLKGSNHEISRNSSFYLNQTEETYNVELINPLGREENPEELTSNISFDVQVTSDDISKLNKEIIANEEGEYCWDSNDFEGAVSCEEYEEGDTVELIETDLSPDMNRVEIGSQRELNVSISYRWKAEIEKNDEIKAETSYHYFDVSGDN